MKIQLKQLQDQVIVLLGATSGIGLVTAMKMAEKGARVVIVGRSQDGLMEAQSQVRSHMEQTAQNNTRINGSRDWMQVSSAHAPAPAGAPVPQSTYPATEESGAAGATSGSGGMTGGVLGTLEDQVMALEADVTNFDQVKSVADQVVQRFGRIDTWVNLAAVSEWALFENTQPEEFHRIIEVNLLGQAYGAMAALPYLRQNGGALIFVASMAGKVPLPYQSAYNASKHGVIGLADTLRLEMKHTLTPISVTSILPTSMSTPLFNKARTRMGVEPEPVKPVYEAGLVAQAIMHAAVHPVRELVVGDAAHMVSFARRLAPTLTSNLMGAQGFRQQRSSEPKSVEAPDNLYEHVGGYNQVEGIIQPNTRSFTPLTWLSTHPRARLGIWAGLLSLAGVLIGWRIVSARNARKRTFSYRAGRFFGDIGAAVVSWPIISSLPMFRRKTVAQRVKGMLPRRRKTLVTRVREIEIPTMEVPNVSMKDVRKQTKKVAARVRDIEIPGLRKQSKGVARLVRDARKTAAVTTAKVVHDTRKTADKAATKIARRADKAAARISRSADKAAARLNRGADHSASHLVHETKKTVDTAAARSMKAIDQAAVESKKAVIKAADAGKDAAVKVAASMPFVNRKSTLERIKDRAVDAAEKVTKR